MDFVTLIMSIIVMICSVVLIAVILFQSGRNAGISGAITGGSNNFYGKNRAVTKDLILKRATVITSIVFITIIIIANIVELIG